MKENEVCLTFDDAIKCQIDVALSVLEDLKIKSFFFVYTSMFEGKPDNLEIFRYIRMNLFNSVDEFYMDFYKVKVKISTNSEPRSLKTFACHFNPHSFDYRLEIKLN